MTARRARLQPLLPRRDWRDFVRALGVACLTLVACLSALGAMIALAEIGLHP